MKDHQDAYGHSIYHYYKNEEGFEIVEREDGYIDASDSLKHFLSIYKDWPSHQKKAMKYVKGKVLDLSSRQKVP